LKKSKIGFVTGMGIMIFGFSMYGIASSIEIPFFDAPIELTSEEEFWFGFKDFGIKFFPVGLVGVVILIISIVMGNKEKMKNQV